MNTTKIVNQIVEIKAQVAAVHKDIFEIISEDLHILKEDITSPRHSTLSLVEEVKNREQIIATNFDYIFILQTVNQDFNILY